MLLSVRDAQERVGIFHRGEGGGGEGTFGSLPGRKWGLFSPFYVEFRNETVCRGMRFNLTYFGASTSESGVIRLARRRELVMRRLV